MYVVGYGKSKLKIARGDIRETGDPVPEAVTWPPHVLKAHLSMNFLMTEDAYKGWKKQAEIHDAYREDRNAKMRTKRKGQEKAITGEEEGQKSEKPKEAKAEQEPGEDKDNEKKEVSDPGELDVKKMSKSQLKKMAKEKGLKISGTKG